MKLAAVLAISLVGAARAQVDPLCIQIRGAIRVLAAARATADADLLAGAKACDTPGDPADLQKSLAALRLTPQRVFARMDQAASALTGHNRFDQLPALAKAALRAGEVDTAQSYARELLQLAPQHTADRDYGDAIYDGYSVMGRIALRRGNVALARQYLMDAASTPGSPSLNQVGPSMMLARELLEKGQEQAVLEFLVLCRTFWKAENGRLGSWSDSIRRHQIPDFGANLDY